MEFRVMSICGDMMFDGFVNLLFDASRVIKRFACPAASVQLCEPDVGFAFFRRELGIVVNSGPLVQLDFKT